MFIIHELGFNFMRKLNKSILVRGLSKIINIHLTIKRNKRRIKVPIINGLGFHNLVVLEKWMDDLISSILKIQEGAFIDVGANLGQTLLNVICNNGGRIDYFGFEPNYTCCNYLYELIRVNRLPNCHVIPVGLSNNDGIFKLFAKSESGREGSFVKGFRPELSYSYAKYASFSSGDTVIPTLGISSISIIKIDVEGGELEVIQGLLKTIRNLKPFIICEILSTTGQFRRNRASQLYKIIIGENYVIYNILNDGNIKNIDKEIMIHNSSLSNFLFVPNNMDYVFKSIF